MTLTFFGKGIFIGKDEKEWRVGESRNREKICKNTRRGCKLKNGVHSNMAYRLTMSCHVQCGFHHA